ncbi:hypothetical protein [Enterovibrio baiacu]|uniref:hypothetical protein n=1 Tax=Enterovibrio baiacu TaxID=2491023 RepID=UPI003D0B7EE7
MGIYQTIILGVVSGILTTCTLFVFSKFITLWLIPRYQEWRYQGADVNGTWVADLIQSEPAIRTKHSLSIRQHAHKLSGSLHFEFESESKSFTTDFEVSGEYWEGYFILVFKSVDRKLFSRASSVMKLIDGGNGMAGHFSFRNVDLDSVSTVPLILTRS